MRARAIHLDQLQRQIAAVRVAKQGLEREVGDLQARLEAGRAAQRQHEAARACAEDQVGCLPGRVASLCVSPCC